MSKIRIVEDTKYDYCVDPHMDCDCGSKEFDINGENIKCQKCGDECKSNCLEKKKDFYILK